MSDIPQFITFRQQRHSQIHEYHHHSRPHFLPRELDTYSYDHAPAFEWAYSPQASATLPSTSASLKRIRSHYGRRLSTSSIAYDGSNSHSTPTPYEDSPNLSSCFFTSSVSSTNKLTTRPSKAWDVFRVYAMCIILCYGMIVSLYRIALSSSSQSPTKIAF